ncbi:hypothetical protein SCG7086_CA_00010 [Chlamydiales bacterium SCGC AG-110-P3]|nr:hypothetical protein SCG7086_CA_00010 [Chlamydiales bacterium SCGC AG-110-P3]
MSVSDLVSVFPTNASLCGLCDFGGCFPVFLTINDIEK